MPVALVLLAALAATPAAAEPAPTAEALFNKWICAACHGKDRAGKAGAPSLKDVAKHWTVDRLADYLVDPAKVIASDPRLKAQAVKYPMNMPSFAAKPLDERRRLAEWLIKESEAGGSAP
jgi:cytochrome c551/c552